MLLNAYHGYLDYAWRIFYASTLCFGLELLFPASKYSLLSRIRAAWFWIVYIAIRVAFFTVFEAIWARFGIRPWFNIDLRLFAASDLGLLKAVGWITVPIFLSMISEFFYYWFHRLQHANRFLWKFHEVHHSLSEMSAWNSNHHWTEEIFRVPMVIIPMSLLFRFDVGYVPVIIFAILGMQGQFEHSCMRLNLGVLRYVLADNRFHRIHHSMERQHWDTNFGSFTSIWDLVFGTACFPRKGEWPEVGLAYRDEPKTLSDFLFMPFKENPKPSGIQQTLQRLGSASLR